MKFQILLFSIIYLIASCSSDTEAQEEQEDSEGVLAFFSELPAHPFENLTFESDLSIVKEQLKNVGYKESQIQPFHFDNPTENIEIILQDTEKLTSFKIFIFDRKKKFYDDLVALFDKKCTKQSKNSNFIVYEFNTNIHEYSGTIFEMENGIRITFNLKTSH